MGLEFTKYGKITFDESKYDYEYDSDSFPSDTLNDFQEILLEHGEVYNLLKPSDIEDSMGHVTNTDNTQYIIYAHFQDITMKDRKIHDMGLAVPGNRKVYLMPQYEIISGGVVNYFRVSEGDIIVDIQQGDGDTGHTGQWRVEKILHEWREPDKTIYISAIVKNINLDGTQ